MRKFTLRVTEEEYQEMLKAQLALSQQLGYTVSLNAYIKSKVCPSTFSISASLPEAPEGNTENTG